jgi:hypothetical protein
MMPTSPLPVGPVFADALTALRAASRPALCYVLLVLLLAVLVDPLLTAYEDDVRVTVALGLGLGAAWWYSWAGLVRSGILALRGEPTSFSDILPPLGAVVRASLAQLVTAIPIALGLLLLIFPGAFLLSVWSQALPLILEGRARAFDALWLSARLTRGARWRVCLVLFVEGSLLAPTRVPDILSRHYGLEVSPIVLSAASLLLFLGWGFDAFVTAALYHRLWLCRQLDRSARGTLDPPGHEIGPVAAEQHPPRRAGVVQEPEPIDPRMVALAERWLARLGDTPDRDVHLAEPRGEPAPEHRPGSPAPGLTTAQLVTLWYATLLVAGLLVLVAFFEHSLWPLVASIVLVAAVTLYTQGPHPAARKWLAVGVALGLLGLTLGLLIGVVRIVRLP